MLFVAVWLSGSSGSGANVTDIWRWASAENPVSRSERLSLGAGWPRQGVEERFRTSARITPGIKAIIPVRSWILQDTSWSTSNRRTGLNRYQR
ncbi:hypothetical protein V8F33_008118 [Rhypophila sp. PSN 637]